MSPETQEPPSGADVADTSADAPLFTVSDKALEVILEARDQDGRADLSARLAIVGRSSAGFQYSFNFLTPDEVADDDTAIELGTLTIYVDKTSAEHMGGAKVDYVTNQWGQGGFQVDNPNPIWSGETANKVQELIDRQINPGIASHGGFVELLEVRETTAYIKLGGGCQGGGMADVTLKQGIEVAIKEAVPEITQVVDTTDHAAGTNPYYQPK